MPITTRPTTPEYAESFDAMFGKRCLRCRKALPTEDIEAGEHPACAERVATLEETPVSGTEVSGTEVSGTEVSGTEVVETET